MGKEDAYGTNLDDGSSLTESRVNIRLSLYGGANVDAFSYVYAATTNLFYSNVMYDVWYQYGFNENGNFQENNERGGAGGDYVNAEAQDGSQVASKVLIMLIFFQSMVLECKCFHGIEVQIKPLIVVSPASIQRVATKNFSRSN
jgi:hypothetical protein